MEEQTQGAGDAKTATESTDPKEAANGTTEAVKPLEEQLAEAKAEAAKNLEGWQRAAAEFANYRKRVDKESKETYGLASVDMLRKIIPVIDDFDRALQHIPADQQNGIAFDSLKLLHRKLLSLLEGAGVKVVNPVDEPFNPTYHEAIGQDEGTGAPSGQVTAVLQKGYVYGDKILRAAMVRVAA